jgi:amino acid transporter
MQRAMPATPDSPPPSGTLPSTAPLPAGRRFRRALFGGPRDLHDTRLFHRLALIPFLAWVGLGADGLSSSAYGPEEAFRALGAHRFLALPLAALMAGTVLLIGAAYRRIIEEFPTGGGGYVVATKLLGERAGLVSGAALLVDYVLTITISIAAAGDALFSLADPAWGGARLPVEIGLIAGLTLLNSRGVRESVLVLLPVFLVFLVTHLVVIGGGLAWGLAFAGAAGSGFSGPPQTAASGLGLAGLLLVFFRAYSLGGGTYTGIEAVSNGLPIMREPRAETGKRTMVYMATSLALTASGLLLCYLLWRIEPVAGKTMNAVLVARLADGFPLGGAFVGLTLFSEAALLVVAAQAGFLDGPRVLANLAVDSWVPHRFAALSERLTTMNGIVLMGGAAVAALWYTGGVVSHLVVMYSINVFLTFSLSMLAMLRLWAGARRGETLWKQRAGLFLAGLVLCTMILCITVVEKFTEGGWVTATVTALVIALCFAIRRHYRRSLQTVDRLYRELGDLPVPRGTTAPVPAADSRQPTAAVLVGSYGGVGIHTLLKILRSFPMHFRQIVFLSVAVVDSGEFKGEHGLDQLREKTEVMLRQYVELAGRLGLSASSRALVHTEVVTGAEQLCLEVVRDYAQVTFFAGSLLFQRRTWWRRLLHNETALAVQDRLQWAGKVMVLVPIRVREVSGAG